MAAYRRVYDSHHLQADCQEPGSAPEPYARKSSMGYLYLFTRPHLQLSAVLRPRAAAPLLFRAVVRSPVHTALSSKPAARRGCCDLMTGQTERQTGGRQTVS